MLDESIQTQLRGYLERLEAPIELVASLDESDASREMRGLVADLGGLSPRLTVRLDGTEHRRPSFSVSRVGETPRIHFAGLPMGHEFTSLILALLQTSGYPPKVDAATLEAARGLPGAHRFETYISLTCQNCPEVVQALNMMAALNPGVTHVMIDGALFQGEIEARQIMAVPTIFRNDERFGQGRMSVEEILAKLDTGTAERASGELSKRAPFEVLIVGGGPAGVAAAIYAARKGIRTGIVAERLGGQVLDTLAIENLISVEYTEGPKLAAGLEQQVRAHGVELITLQRAETLEPAPPGGLHTLRLAGGGTLRARTVILATGAHWRELKVPGEAEYRTKGVAFCPHCDGPLFKGRPVAVIGGGNSGVEAAIDLAGVVGHVTLLEFDSKLRADAVLQTKLNSLPNVKVLLNAQTTEVTGDGRKVNGLVYRHRETGDSHRVVLDGVFVQIGLLPNTDWLRGTVALSKHGEIEVDARGETSVPGVFAAGDATTTPYKQIIIAMGDGAKASLSAFDYLIRTPVSPEAGVSGS